MAVAADSMAAAADSIPAAPAGSRLIVVGRNSILWSRIAARVLALRPDTVAVGHRDLAAVRAAPNDEVWIFSYSLRAEENQHLFDAIAAMGAGRHFYVSSATANIAGICPCYRYPRVKAAGEADAARVLGAVPVRIGLIHDGLAELPAGLTAATRLDDLVDAMAGGRSFALGPDGVRHLYQLAERPFANAAEAATYRLYGHLLRIMGARACWLRPFDLVLRTIGWRWYGYFRMSNDRCCLTTSS